MAKIDFDLHNASADFRKGFMAALDFIDGMPQGQQTISLDYSTHTHVGITMDDGGANDNRTYCLRRGKLVYDSLGVER